QTETGKGAAGARDRVADRLDTCFETIAGAQCQAQQRPHHAVVRCVLQDGVVDGFCPRQVAGTLPLQRVLHRQRRQRPDQARMLRVEPVPNIDALSVRPWGRSLPPASEAPVLTALLNSEVTVAVVAVLTVVEVVLVPASDAVTSDMSTYLLTNEATPAAVENWLMFTSG